MTHDLCHREAFGIVGRKLLQGLTAKLLETRRFFDFSRMDAYLVA